MVLHKGIDEIQLEEFLKLFMVEGFNVEFDDDDDGCREVAKICVDLWDELQDGRMDQLEKLRQIHAFMQENKHKIKERLAEQEKKFWESIEQEDEGEDSEDEDVEMAPEER